MPELSKVSPDFWDFVPCLSASPRLCERQNILSQRRRDAETGTQSSLISCRNYPRETVSDRLRQPGTRDKSCKYRKLNSPGLGHA